MLLENPASNFFVRIRITAKKKFSYVNTHLAFNGVRWGEKKKRVISGGYNCSLSTIKIDFLVWLCPSVSLLFKALIVILLNRRYVWVLFGLCLVWFFFSKRDNYFAPRWKHALVYSSFEESFTRDSVTTCFGRDFMGGVLEVFTFWVGFLTLILQPDGRFRAKFLKHRIVCEISFFQALLKRFSLLHWMRQSRSENNKIIL